MIRLNGKKVILLFLAAALCVTACVPAFASVGDRILMRYSTADGYGMDETVQTVVRAGDGICVVLRGQDGRKFLVYKDPKGEPETYTMPDNREPNITQDENGSDIRHYEDMSSVFGWNGEIYALVSRQVSGEDFWKMDGASVKHVKLENGEAVLEDSGLPDMDITDMLNGDDEYQYFDGLNGAFTSGDKLIGQTYGEEGPKLCVVDLQEGTTDVTDLDDSVASIVAGPEGSVLVTRINWESEKAIASMSRMDLADKSEEPLWEKTGEDLYGLNPCYDPESDMLFFAYKGELWRMPLAQPDFDQAESVNDCPSADSGAILLPDGFMVLWSYNVVLLKNTDPAQRGSVTLRIKDFNYSNALSEAIYDMNNTRGDVSVVLDQEYTENPGVLQAMMNRDAYFDIYAMEYEGSDCSALRNRGYMLDLSGNEQIAECVNRMYPYLRDAVEKDGKIIGVPVEAYGSSFGINLDVLERLGLKEEDLPKTWEQFFDWVEALPEVLAGQKEASLAGSWEDRLYVRAAILNNLLNQYQVWMDGKGENYLFNSPLLNGLITRLNNLDYEGLGAREHIEDDEGESYDYDEEEYREPLLELYYESTPGGYNSRCKPLLLSFAEGEDPVVPVTITIAYVNPYTEHPQEAMEFLAHSMKNLYTDSRYTVFADQTEAFRYPWYEENLKNWKEELEEYKKQLQEETEDDNRKSLEEEIENLEKIIDDEEKYSWVMSPEEIERYQKNQHLYKVQDYNFIHDMMKNNDDKKEDEEESEYTNEYYDLVYGEKNFGLSADELLNTIDKKIQMIRLEGN